MVIFQMKCFNTETYIYKKKTSLNITYKKCVQVLTHKVNMKRKV